MACYDIGSGDKTNQKCYVLRPTCNLERPIFLTDRCLKWVENSRRKDLEGKEADILYRSYSLCSAHFEDSQFMNAQLKNSLVWNAIPTLFDVPDPPLSIAEEKANGCSLFPPSPARDDSDDDFAVSGKHLLRFKFGSIHNCLLSYLKISPQKIR